jgi:hypothetical protein
VQFAIARAGRGLQSLVASVPGLEQGLDRDVFDFDFFRSDRLVCTGVIYRAYDGLGDLRFELRERGGRPTFSAEDLLDLAVDRGQFEPIALFGAEPTGGHLVTGEGVRAALAASYR